MLKPSRNFSFKPTLSNAAVVNLSPYLPITAPATSPLTALVMNVPFFTKLLNDSAVFVAASKAFVASEAFFNRSACSTLKVPARANPSACLAASPSWAAEAFNPSA